MHCAIYILAASAALADAAASLPRVQMDIKQLGSVVIEIDEVAAPVTAANFLQYVEEEYFDGLLFHRVARRRETHICSAVSVSHAHAHNLRSSRAS